MSPEEMAKCQEVALRAANSAVADLVTGGQVSNQDKGLDYVIRDTEYVLSAGGAQSVRLFTNDLFRTGTPQAGATKSDAEFNLDAPGQFNEPNTFNQLGCRMTLLPLISGNAPISAADFLELKSHAYLTYIEGQREVFRIRLEQLSGLGLEVLTNTSGSAQDIQFGSSFRGNYYRFGNVLVNKPNEQFSWRLDTTSEMAPLDADVRFRFTVYGALQTTAG